MADVQRKRERKPLQPAHRDQQVEREQAEREVDVFHSALVAVPSRHSVLSPEHAVLRTGNRSDRGRRRHVRDRAEPGVRARPAHRPSDLALLAPALDRPGLRCVTRHEPRRRRSRRSRVHGHRQRALDCVEPRHRPARVGGRHARRGAEVRRDHGATHRQRHGDRRRLGRRLGHSRIPCSLQSRDRRTRLAPLDHSGQRRSGL